jgi:hypothetical protein
LWPIPNRRFGWHEHIKDVEGEYQAARIAVDRLMVEVVATDEDLTQRRKKEAWMMDSASTVR